MALLDDVRGAMFLTSSKTDSVLRGYIASALEDMRRVGVREELLDPDTIDPMAANAVIAYCKAYYHVDSIQTPAYVTSYNRLVTALMNSDKSYYLGEEDGE